MFYNSVEFIFDELDNLSVENKLTENLKLIAYLRDSSKPEDIQKHFRVILDRMWQLSDSKDNNYTLYISNLVLIFFKEFKKDFPQIFLDLDFLKNVSLFFSYVEKILKKETSSGTINSDRKKEIVEILKSSFSEEYYYRKNERLNPKQLNLPF